MHHSTRLAAPLLALLSLLAALLVAVPATADVPDGARYAEHWFPMADGTVLHADVLRDADVAWDVAQPVVMVVSPYVNHNGSTSDVDPLGGDGPNERFHDFLELSGILERGYTYALVDLPGFGGSGGCNDWGGLREQGAVHAAVEWAARVDLSTGEVGAQVRQPVALLGKSYDGWTGLMGMAQDRVAGGVDGLAAVISMEPVFSGYRYLYDDGVELPNAGALGTLNNFQRYDAKPGAVNDDPEYHLNSLLGGTPATCYAENLQGAENDRADAPYWVERDLLPATRGSDVPLFLMQGFLETNTKPDAAFAFWNGLDHSHGGNRAWFGQYDHVRGWDRVGGPLGDGELETGRDGFIEQAVEFLDEHLKGIEPAERRPAVEVQSSTGEWRAESQWPPADVDAFTTYLGYVNFDDVRTNGDGPGSGGGTWVVSQVLDRDVHLAGEPHLSGYLGPMGLVEGMDYAVNVYDVDETAGVATLVSRATEEVRRGPVHAIDQVMYGQDWVFGEGHRIAVVLSGGNEDWWDHEDTGTSVTSEATHITLPLRTGDDARVLPSTGTSPRLRQHLVGGTVPLSAVDLSQEVVFALPR